MSEADAASTYDEALKIAGELIDAGVPVFAAAPNPDRPGHYYLPKEWEKTTPDRAHLDKWRPGWALGAVGGHVADFLDFDPRNGGDQSMRELEIQRQMPRAFGVQATPSGGTHLVISPTGERKSTGFMPGVDLQSGNDQGVGRGFVYIAPTVRPSKAPETLGELRAYRWEQPPDMEYLKEFDRGADDTLEGVVARVHAVRNAVTPRESVTPVAGGSQLFMQGGSGHREFTREQAEAFCTPHLMELQRAQIGEIEEHANRAAAALSHFVPALWSADEAFTVLSVALKQTAYDPAHPASGWDAEKFRAVLDGRRPPLDAWKATKRAESVAEVTPASDAVDALIGEMRKPSEVIAQPPPRPLVRGLLNLDSESWIIGAPGSKKSFVAADIAGHVAHGMTWQGRRVHQGRVVMIVAEGAGGLGPRLRAWEMEHGKAMSDDVLILPRPVQAADLPAWAVLIEACRRLEPVLVVLDTQARMTVGLEENSAKEMGVFIEAVRAIREATGACVLTVHHTGRQGGDARGSSAIDGAQHTELKVVAEKGSLRGKLISEKQKDMALADDLELVFAVHTVGVDEDGEDITSLALVSDAFRRLAGTGETPLAEEEWIAPVESVRSMVLRVLTDHGEDRGVTSADARRIVIERWYGGDASRLRAATWRTSWNRAIKDESVINVGGERFTMDRLNSDEVS
jgi:hypothetical protein